MHVQRTEKLLSVRGNEEINSFTALRGVKSMEQFFKVRKGIFYFF